MSNYNSIGGAIGPNEWSRTTDPSFPDRPLFGQPTLWDRIANFITIGVPGILISITLLGALIKPETTGGTSKGINIYFAICLSMSGIAHAILIYWYRQGDVDPKFRYLIYSNTFIIVLLCICAHLYIYNA